MLFYSEIASGCLRQHEQQPCRLGQEPNPVTQNATRVGHPSLPSPRLQHVGLVQPCHRQSFHRSYQIFADFK